MLLRHPYSPYAARARPPNLWEVDSLAAFFSSSGSNYTISFFTAWFLSEHSELAIIDLSLRTL